MKKFILFTCLAMIANASLGATYPGATISRANCWAPFPKSQLTPVGAGWYNESFTYDRAGFQLYLANSTGQFNYDLTPFYHVAYVVSDQSRTNSPGQVRLTSGNSYINSWRIYAGQAKPALLPYPETGPYYAVKGTHWEKLNAGSTLQYITNARGCFDNAFL